MDRQIQHDGLKSGGFKSVDQILDPHPNCDSNRRGLTVDICVLIIMPNRYGALTVHSPAITGYVIPPCHIVLSLLDERVRVWHLRGFVWISKESGELWMGKPWIINDGIGKRGGI